MPNPHNNPTCETCRWFLVRCKPNGEPRTFKDARWGDCNRYPTAATKMEHDFCGEHPEAFPMHCLEVSDEPTPKSLPEWFSEKELKKWYGKRIGGADPPSVIKGDGKSQLETDRS